jgi:glyoxylase-like metal-dependent hydrolase (beta-lactamase superfamily II)
MAVCLSGAVVASSQEAPVAPPYVREGATEKVGPHSYVIPDNHVGQVPNVGFVVGTRATLVIDPGLGRRNGEAVRREVARFSRNTEMYLASTHYHTEHTSGHLAFPVSARYVNSTVQEADFVEGAAQHAKSFAGRSAVHAELVKDVTQRKADITFERDYLLDLGGVRVRFLVVGPTHTRGDTILFVEGDNVLFAGDVVMKNSFVAANASASMKSWLAAYDVLEAMRPRVIVPSHGPIGDGSLIAINREFMQYIQARTRALKAEGRPLDDIATIVQSEMTAKHPTFERANGTAGAARAAYAEAP